MNRITNNDLEKILINKTRGSSEIVGLLNKHFLINRYKHNELKRIIKIAKEKLGHFETVNSYLGELSANLKSGNEEELKYFLVHFEQEESKKYNRLFDKIYPEIKNFDKILTLSRSSTVIKVLKLFHKRNKSLSVTVCESRPKLEGRLTAEELAKSGVKVLLITDAMMNLLIPKVDAAIIGADIILRNENIVNKVGSKSLAILCRGSKKPCYVVSTKSKKSNRSTFKQKFESPNEILGRKIKNLTTQNIYFELIEKKYLTRIFTD